MNTLEPKPVCWTREDYYRMARAGLFDERRVELIRGDVIEMTPQESRHATAITLAHKTLASVYSGAFVVRVQLPLVLGRDSEPEPDIAVVRGEPRDYADEHPVTALLVLEAADSSLAFDRTVKSALYADGGVEEYWILNLVDRQLEVFRDPHRGGYRESFVVPADGTIEPPSAPGGAVRVADLLP